VDECIDIIVDLPGREHIELSMNVDAQGNIQSAKLHGIGGPDLLDLLVSWRPKFTGNVKNIEVPEGSQPAAILLREIILKAKGQWNYPYNEDELCHCRAVPTKIVDMAIVTGAHTPEKVSQQTSSSTGCGTCRPDVESIIEYRLRTQKKSNKSVA